MTLYQCPESFSCPFFYFSHSFVFASPTAACFGHFLLWSSVMIPFVVTTSQPSRCLCFRQDNQLHCVVVREDDLLLRYSNALIYSYITLNISNMFKLTKTPTHSSLGLNSALLHPCQELLPHFSLYTWCYYLLVYFSICWIVFAI